METYLWIPTRTTTPQPTFQPYLKAARMPPKPQRSGHLSETNIGLGSGLNERLYIGTSIGIVSVDFKNQHPQERPLWTPSHSANGNSKKCSPLKAVASTSSRRYACGHGLAPRWTGLPYAKPHHPDRCVLHDGAKRLQYGEAYDYNSPFNRLRPSSTPRPASSLRPPSLWARQAL